MYMYDVTFSIQLPWYGCTSTRLQKSQSLYLISVLAHGHLMDFYQHYQRVWIKGENTVIENTTKTVLQYISDEAGLSNFWIPGVCSIPYLFNVSQLSNLFFVPLAGV